MFQKVNNKGADQTARMRRLVCVFVVRIQQSQVISRRGPQSLGPLMCKTIPGNDN